MGFPVKSNGASDLTNEDQESRYIGKSLILYFAKNVTAES